MKGGNHMSDYLSMLLATPIILIVFWGVGLIASNLKIAIIICLLLIGGDFYFLLDTPEFLGAGILTGCLFIFVYLIIGERHIKKDKLIEKNNLWEEMDYRYTYYRQYCFNTLKRPLVSSFISIVLVGAFCALCIITYQQQNYIQSLSTQIEQQNKLINKQNKKIKKLSKEIDSLAADIDSVSSVTDDLDSRISDVEDFSN